MNHHLPWHWLLGFILLLATVGNVGGYELSPSDRELLEQAQSPYKVSPEKEAALLSLLAPFKLDGEVPGGYVLDGFEIDKHLVRVVLKGQGADVSVYLLPPVLEVEGALASPSFKLLVEGDSAGEAGAAIVAAVVKNDDGSFWPEPEVSAEGAGRRVPVVARKIHALELVGDFFVVLLIFALVLGVPRLGRSFSGRPLSWWWSLLAVVAYAFLVRGVVAYMVHGDEQSVLWSPSSQLAHSSVAWILGTLGRFVPVSTGLVAMFNLLFAVLTVLCLFLVLSLLVPGNWPALVGAMVVASAPMHVTLASTITVMIPFVMFLSGALLCLVAYARDGDVRVYWLGNAALLFAVFARPEGVLLVLPLVALTPLLVAPASLRKASFLVPFAAQLGILTVRLATIGSGPDYGDPFLSWQVDFAAFHANVGNWLFGFGRVSFAAMVFWAMGVAARPWRRDLRLTVVMAVWLILGIVVYYHVDMTNGFQGGRVALYCLVPLAWVAAWGGYFLVNLGHTQRWWVMVLLLLWLLLTPLIHRTAIDRDFKATYRQNFLIEA